MCCNPNSTFVIPCPCTCSSSSAQETSTNCCHILHTVINDVTTNEGIVTSSSDSEFTKTDISHSYTYTGACPGGPERGIDIPPPPPPPPPLAFEKQKQRSSVINLRQNTYILYKKAYFRPSFLRKEDLAPPLGDSWACPSNGILTSKYDEHFMLSYFSEAY